MVSLLKKHWQWTLITSVFFGLAFIFIRDEFFDFGGDSAQYIIIAESVVSGLGFKLINYPGAPISFL